MKKILGLAIAAVLVIAMIGGGTWAYFSDTQSSTGNTLIAGTLNLGLANTSGQNPTGDAVASWNVTATNWGPGDTKDGHLFLKNSGTIAMASANITFSYTSVTEGTPNVNVSNPETDYDKLDKMITATTATLDTVSVPAIAGKTLFYLKNNPNISLGSIGAGAEKDLYIVWTFDTTAQNGCQGDSIDLTVTVSTTQ